MAIVPSTNILTEVQTAFLERFQLGMVAVGRDAISLVSILAAIEIALFGLWWALSGSDAAAAAFRKILTLGLFTFVISNYQPLLDVVIDGFSHTAERAAGARVASIDDPSAIIDAAFTATLPALELARKRVGIRVSAIIDALVIVCCVLGIFLAYCTLAIQVFITRLEFGLVSTLGLILIPFGVLKQTAFIAEKTFGAILGFGIKLMVLAFIISVSWPILASWALPDDPDWGHLFNMLASTIALAALAFHAPSVTSAMLWGSPSLSSSHLTSAAASVASPVLGALGRTAASGPARYAGDGVRAFGKVAASQAAGALASAFSRKEGSSEKKQSAPHSKSEGGQNKTSLSSAAVKGAEDEPAGLQEQKSPVSSEAEPAKTEAAHARAGNKSSALRKNRESLQHENAAYRPYRAQSRGKKQDANVVPSLRREHGDEQAAHSATCDSDLLEPASEERNFEVTPKAGQNVDAASDGKRSLSSDETAAAPLTGTRRQRDFSDLHITGSENESLRRQMAGAERQSAVESSVLKVEKIKPEPSSQVGHESEPIPAARKGFGKHRPQLETTEPQQDIASERFRPRTFKKRHLDKDEGNDS